MSFPGDTNCPVISGDGKASSLASPPTRQLNFYQAMADFKAMFPAMDDEIIEAVLRANNGAVDRTIDLLLTMSGDTDNVPPIQESDWSKTCETGLDSPGGVEWTDAQDEVSPVAVLTTNKWSRIKGTNIDTKLNVLSSASSAAVNKKTLGRLPLAPSDDSDWIERELLLLSTDTSPPPPLPPRLSPSIPPKSPQSSEQPVDNVPRNFAVKKEVCRDEEWQEGNEWEGGRKKVRSSWTPILPWQLPEDFLRIENADRKRANVPSNQRNPATKLSQTMSTNEKLSPTSTARSYRIHHHGTQFGMRQQQRRSLESSLPSPCHSSFLPSPTHPSPTRSCTCIQGQLNVSTLQHRLLENDVKLESHRFVTDSVLQEAEQTRRLLEDERLALLLQTDEFRQHTFAATVHEIAGKQTARVGTVGGLIDTGFSVGMTGGGLGDCHSNPARNISRLGQAQCGVDTVEYQSPAKSPLVGLATERMERRGESKTEESIADELQRQIRHIGDASKKKLTVAAKKLFARRKKNSGIQNTLKDCVAPSMINLLDDKEDDDEVDEEEIVEDDNERWRHSGKIL